MREGRDGGREGGREEGREGEERKRHWQREKSYRRNLG